MLIFDAHLDLSMNALDQNRDLRRSVAEIRAAETGPSRGPGWGRGTVAFPDMRRGGIGLCVATLIAPCARPENPIRGWNSPQQAWAQVCGQLAWYRAMEEDGELSMIRDVDGLDAHLAKWSTACESGAQEDRPIGFVLSLEGADPLVDIGCLEELWAAGLRAMGPAHYGAGRYANGTDASGGLPPCGRELLAEMDRLGMILDVTHLCDESLEDALEIYEGPIWASHSNSRALVPHNRQFDDDQLRALIARGAVIGAVLDTWMLVPGWVRGKSTPAAMGADLEKVADHIEHVCEIAGTTAHSGIGSDLDGGFGREQSPADLETIADLRRLQEILARRGFSEDAIESIFHGNFVELLRRSL